jgi:hypothetical protein
MVRLLHVAIGGVCMLVSLVIAGFGLMVTLGNRVPAAEGALRWVGFGLLAAGVGGFLVSGGIVLWLIVDWRRHRGERSHRP